MSQDLLFDLLLVLNMIVCLLLIGVVLMQRSEGGAFGTGGPTGLVTARGAGDLLTRTTWVLFTLFLVFSLALTLIGGRERSSQAILNRLKNVTVNPEQILKQTPPTPPATPAAAPSAPAQSSPPSLTLPPVGAPVHPQAARAPQPTRRTANPAAAPTIITAPIAQPNPSLALPPIGGSPTNSAAPQ
ncbi:MAG TPA: preprotein translocase subunit SecG [Caulobacteraceae bacterium]|jgi:preprotein translocase subunit SecG|nr:preprotein translocase subunit SecG [Caulobacteraceae bacterium]